jgi:peptide deformylase
MALRIIRKAGDPVLREAAKEVRKITPVLKILLDDMVETMYSVQGVGLAAPQVGVGKRVIVVDARDEYGLLKLINPVITGREGRETDVEGCLSFPGIQGEVERDHRITLRAFDPEGKEMEICAGGLLARALQHEIDHLDGVLFVDRAIQIVEEARSKAGR